MSKGELKYNPLFLLFCLVFLTINTKGDSLTQEDSVSKIYAFEELEEDIIMRANYEADSFSIKTDDSYFLNSEDIETFWQGEIECQIEQMVDSIISIGHKYLGKPYRYRTADGNILDCSGYICQIFSSFQIQLPHSSGGIYDVVQKVDFEDIQIGDLIFFGQRNRFDRVGHVAMIIEIDKEEITMMHSCNSGIIIEPYNGNTYYETRFIGLGRIPIEKFPIQRDFELEVIER